MPFLRLAALLPVCMGLALPLRAQPAPPGQPAPPPAYAPEPTITTTFRQVVLDVVVTDSKGHPVTGLQPSDFVLSEDKVPQTLVHFSEHTSASPEAPLPVPTLPPNTFIDHAPLTGNRPVTVILFDELSFADAAYARSEVASFMKTLTPGMPICIFRLDSYGLHLVQDFTTDPQLLRDAVKSKRNEQPMQIPIYARPWFMRDTVRELAAYLAGFSGRKNLIWFTDGRSTPSGIGPDSFPDMNSFLDDPRGTADILTLSRVALYPIDARGLVVNPGRGFYVLAQDGYLADLAAATGGRAFYSTNGFRQAVAQVVSTGSNYDTLAYNPSNRRWDGSFRTIQVKLLPTALAHASSPDGQRLSPPFRLEYRTGYYARATPLPRPPSHPGQARRMISYSPRGDPNGPGAAIAAPFDRAMALGAIAPFQVLFRAHITPDLALHKIKRHDEPPPDTFLQSEWLHRPYRNYLIHYSINSADVRFAFGPGDTYLDTLEITAVVYDDRGQIADGITANISVNLKLASYLKAIRESLGFDQQIAIPAKGNFMLRLGVHDLNSGRIGALEIPVESIQLSPAAPRKAASSPAATP